MTSPTDRRRSRAALASVATAGALIVMKLVTAVLTGSLAIVASLIDSVMDLVASTTNLFAIRQSEQPPDADHRWGHGKAESLASLAQAALVAASAATVVWQAVNRLLHPRAVTNAVVGIVVMAVSMVASAALTWFLRRASRRLASMALAADALHYMSDVLTNGAALLALAAWAYRGWGWFNPVVSLGIAGVLAHSAWGIGRESVDMLMDRELSDDVRDEVQRIASGASQHVFGVHELRTRRSGRTVVIDLHLEVRADLSFRDAHEVSAEVQRALQQRFEDAIVTIHPDPYLAAGEPLQDDCSHVSGTVS